MIAKQKDMSVTALINTVMSDYAEMNNDAGFITEFRKRFEAIEKEIFGNKK